MPSSSGSDEIVPTAPFVKGITDTLAKVCGPNCKFTYVNAPVPEWSTKIKPSVQSALIADPTINYVIPIYDSMSQFVIPAITITGKKDSVKIATFNGTPFVIDAVRRGRWKWTWARASAGSPLGSGRLHAQYVRAQDLQ